MKPRATKESFIQLRAEGLSYDSIAERLHISKSTCCKWEQELKGSIDQLRQESLNKLYESYGMAKEGRIRRLGETVNRIGAALGEMDFSTMPPDKLLKLYLDYSKALKEEYTGATPTPSLKANQEPETVLQALGSLFDRINAGEIPPDQAALEGKILTSLLAAHEQVRIKNRLDEIDLVLNG